MKHKRRTYALKGQSKEKRQGIEGSDQIWQNFHRDAPGLRRVLENSYQPEAAEDLRS